jgi:hypothetical protein
MRIVALQRENTYEVLKLSLSLFDCDVPNSLVVPVGCPTYSERIRGYRVPDRSRAHAQDLYNFDELFADAILVVR